MTGASHAPSLHATHQGLARLRAAEAGGCQPSRTVSRALGASRQFGSSVSLWSGHHPQAGTSCGQKPHPSPSPRSRSRSAASHQARSHARHHRPLAVTRCQLGGPEAGLGQNSHPGRYPQPRSRAIVNEMDDLPADSLLPAGVVPGHSLHRRPWIWLPLRSDLLGILFAGCAKARRTPRQLARNQTPLPLSSLGRSWT